MSLQEPYTRAGVDRHHPSNMRPFVRSKSYHLLWNGCVITKTSIWKRAWIAIFIFKLFIRTLLGQCQGKCSHLKHLGIRSLLDTNVAAYPTGNYHNHPCCTLHLCFRQRAQLQPKSIDRLNPIEQKELSTPAFTVRKVWNPTCVWEIHPSKFAKRCSSSQAYIHWLNFDRLVSSKWFPQGATLMRDHTDFIQTMFCYSPLLIHL